MELDIMSKCFTEDDYFMLSRDKVISEEELRFRTLLNSSMVRI